MLRHDVIHHSTGKIPKAVLSKIKADHDQDYQTLEEEQRDTASEERRKVSGCSQLLKHLISCLYHREFLLTIAKMINY